jgi:hypothetical protein
LVAIAVLAIWAAADLPGQRGFSLGPGTAPRIFAGLLLALGLAVATSGFISAGPPIESFAIRGSLFICAAILLFCCRGDHPVHGHFWVPIDDENCWAWSFDYHPVRALTEAERSAMKAGKGIHVQYVSGTYRPHANKDNDCLMDREAQPTGASFSGIEGIGMQDASLQESLGPIVDRTKETLVSTDNGIIMARHRLMKAAQALRDKGTTPPGVDPVHHQVRSAAIVLEPDKSFVVAAQQDLTVRHGLRHSSV